MNANKVKKMRKILKSERECLWSDLESAKRRAINGQWSMECDWLLDRIRSIDPFLKKPMDWQQIGMPFLEEFERLEGDAGIDAGIDWDQVRELRGQ